MKLVVLALLVAAVSASAITPKILANHQGGTIEFLRDEDTNQIWKDCSGAADHYKIKSIKITPDPPTIGSTVDVVADGTLDEDVTAGKMQFQVFCQGTKVLDLDRDFCEDIECPVAKGDWSHEEKIEIPGFTPAGVYDGKMVGLDQNGEELACITFKFRMHH